MWPLLKIVHQLRTVDLFLSTCLICVYQPPLPFRVSTVLQQILQSSDKNRSSRVISLGETQSRGLSRCKPQREKWKHTSFSQRRFEKLFNVLPIVPQTYSSKLWTYFFFASFDYYCANHRLIDTSSEVIPTTHPSSTSDIESVNPPLTRNSSASGKPVTLNGATITFDFEGAHKPLVFPPFLLDCCFIDDGDEEYELGMLSSVSFYFEG